MPGSPAHDRYRSVRTQLEIDSMRRLLVVKSTKGLLFVEERKGERRTDVEQN
jgi:hypothetical protein